MKNKQEFGDFINKHKKRLQDKTLSLSVEVFRSLFIVYSDDEQFIKTLGKYLNNSDKIRINKNSSMPFRIQIPWVKGCDVLSYIKALVGEKWKEFTIYK